MGINLVIFGSGSMARTLANEISSDYNIAFCADDEFVNAADIIPFSKVRFAAPPERYNFIVACSFAEMNAIRKARYDAFRSIGYKPTKFIGSCVRYSRSSFCGDGVTIYDFTAIHAGSEIGNNVLISTNCSIGHDCSINSHSWLNSGVCLGGGVKIGERCVLGMNCTIAQGVTLGEAVYVGANALVTKDIPAGGVVVAENSGSLLEVDSARFLKITKQP